MPRRDNPEDLKAFTAAALIGLLAGRGGGNLPTEWAANEALKHGIATRAAVRRQLETEDRQAEREAAADREDASRP